MLWPWQPHHGLLWPQLVWRKKSRCWGERAQVWGKEKVALGTEDHRTFWCSQGTYNVQRCSSNPRKGEKPLKTQLKFSFHQVRPWDTDLIRRNKVMSCPLHSTCTNCGASVRPLQIKAGQDPQGTHIWARAVSLLEGRSDNQVLVQRIIQIGTGRGWGTL